MLPKESKMRILENFYAIDYTLFGKPVTKVDTCCPETLKEFLSVKGALLSVMIEMCKLSDHLPTPIDEKITTKDIKEYAKNSASIARENAQILVKSDKGRQEVKRELNESLKSGDNLDMTVEEIVENKIREKTFSLALDNLLIARTINESISYENLNETEGQILEDAYKILRNSLVELAIFIDEHASITR